MGAVIPSAALVAWPGASQSARLTPKGFAMLKSITITAGSRLEVRTDMKKTLIVGLAILAFGALTAGAADAKAIYEKDCAKCHGPDGKGDTKMGKKAGAKDYTDAKVQAEMKDDQMAKAIKEGVKDGDTVKMKAFSDALSDEEIKALVGYVRTFKK
jgi:mono/diheme cytochrome c family protein